MSNRSNTNLLKVLGVRVSKTTYPTGNPNFSVKQCFPAGFDEVESDPFLMCDYFGPKKSEGISNDPDHFNVGWHPHRGMDICTYLKEGVGRHADSLGNRGEYATPGLQWISVGSGIEHAEGGGTPAGQNDTGFQIWINVPAKHKMDDPKYGTVGPTQFPLIEQPSGVSLRLLGGAYEDKKGPFVTKQPIQMIDYFIPAGVTHLHSVPLDLDNCLIYLYEGSGEINGQSLQRQQIIRLDAASSTNGQDQRNIMFTGGSDGLSAMLFAGKKIGEPIAWRGPFVMNTQAEIESTFAEYRRGTFPPKRAPWDYKKLSAFPRKVTDAAVVIEGTGDLNEINDPLSIGKDTGCM